MFGVFSPHAVRALKMLCENGEPEHAGIKNDCLKHQLLQMCDNNPCQSEGSGRKAQEMWLSFCAE